MAIPKMEDDVEIISKLGDVPGSDNGFSTQQLKDAFDRGSVLIKNFINNVLIAELNSLVDVQALLNNILDSTLKRNDKAANAKVTGEELNKKLDKAGGTMTGKLNMSGNEIQQVGYPTADSSAANKNYVDSRKVAVSVNLPAAGWEDNQQTVNVAGVTADNHVLVTPAPESFVMYGECVVFCSAQSEGSLTFTCDDVPAEDLTLNILIMN